MAAQTNQFGDTTVNGQLTVSGGPVILPPNSLKTSSFDPATPLDAVQLQIQIHQVYAQGSAVDATAAAEVVHVARAAGTLVAVRAGNVVSGIGGATATVDVKKNGTTVLTGTIGLAAAAPAAYGQVAGAVAGGSAAYAAGDVFEVVVTAAAGGGTLAKGLFVDLVFREANGG